MNIPDFESLKEDVSHSLYYSIKKYGLEIACFAEVASGLGLKVEDLGKTVNYLGSDFVIAGFDIQCASPTHNIILRNDKTQITKRLAAKTVSKLLKGEKVRKDELARARHTRKSVSFAN